MKIYLAPMEGVVDWPMRETLSSIGGFDQMVTEFIRITSQLLPAKVFYRYCPELKTGGKTLNGTPVFVQLLGSQANVMAENAQRAVELGAPGIDLNFGCPAKTVNRHDGGATLLKDPNRIFKIVSQIRQTLPAHIPLTAKVRLGFDHKNFVEEIALAVQQGGAQRITIHARTKIEAYRPPAHWEYIAQMRSVVPDLEVVANGDIWNCEDFDRCKKITNCGSFALGRPIIANPFLALQIRKMVEGEKVLQEDFDAFLKQHFLSFLKVTLEHRGEAYALARCKQWLRQLPRQWPDSQAYFEVVKREKKLNLALSHLFGNGHILTDTKPGPGEFVSQPI